ncbi:MAG: hypothetical protein AB1345_02255 [Chloroflexota bacterium]
MNAPNPPPTNQEKPQRKRKKQAKKALLTFLRHLRRACTQFETLEKWIERVAELEELLSEYPDVFSKEQQKKLKEAAKLTNSTQAGIRAACKLLSMEIENVLAGMVIGGTATSVILGIFIVGAIMAGGVVAYLRFIPSSASVVMINEGCPDIPVGEALSPMASGLLSTFNLEVPDTVYMNDQAEMEVPALPISLTLQFTAPSTLGIRLGWFSIPLSLSSSVDSLQLDGEEVLTGSVSKGLREAPTHTILIHCP